MSNGDISNLRAIADLVNENQMAIFGQSQWSWDYPDELPEELTQAQQETIDAIETLKNQAGKELHQPIRTFLKILFRRPTVVRLNTLFKTYGRNT